MKKFIIALLLISGVVLADAVIFSGADVKTLKQNINLFGQARIVTGTADPTSVAQNAPQGSLYLRTGGSGGTAYIKQDNGNTTNWTALSMGSGGGGAFAGESIMLGTSGCTWQTTSTSLAAFGSQANCGGPSLQNTYIGTWQTTDTDLPQQTINNLPAGKYIVIVHLVWYGTSNGAYANFAINDGSATFGYTDVFVDSGSAAHPPDIEIIGEITYGATANRTFSVFGAVSAGTLIINNDRATNSGGLRWMVIQLN